MTDEYKNWFDDEVEISKATLKEFDGFVEEYCQVKDQADRVERELADLNKKMKAMQAKLIACLEEQGKTSYVTRNGKMSIVTRTDWKAPEGDGREEVIKYLKETDNYDAVVGFNAAKFSGWFKQEKEANPNFDLKGVEQKIIKYITMRR